MEVRLRPVRDDDVTVFEVESSTPEGAGELQWFGFRNWHQLRRRLADDGNLGPDSGGLTIDVDGAVAGLITWHKVFWGPEATSWSWNLGIRVFPAFRGKGVGTEAQIQIVDYLFAHTRAERIQASTDIANLAERRALEKAGFQEEGVIRRSQWRKGQWHDQVLYAVLRDSS